MGDRLKLPVLIAFVVASLTPSVAMADDPHMNALWLQVALALRAEMAVAYVCDPYFGEYEGTKSSAEMTLINFNFGDQREQMVAQYERENMALLAGKPKGWPVIPLNKTNCTKQYIDALTKEQQVEAPAMDYLRTIRCFVGINC
jgi:hypothetical protein